MLKITVAALASVPCMTARPRESEGYTGLEGDTRKVLEEGNRYNNHWATGTARRVRGAVNATQSAVKQVHHGYNSAKEQFGRAKKQFGRVREHASEYTMRAAKAADALYGNARDGCQTAKGELAHIFHGHRSKNLTVSEEEANQRIFGRSTRQAKPIPSSKSDPGRPRSRGGRPVLPRARSDPGARRSSSHFNKACSDRTPSQTSVFDREDLLDEEQVKRIIAQNQMLRNNMKTAYPCNGCWGVVLNHNKDCPQQGEPDVLARKLFELTLDDFRRRALTRYNGGRKITRRRRLASPVLRRMMHEINELN